MFWKQGSSKNWARVSSKTGQQYLGLQGISCPARQRLGPFKAAESSKFPTAHPIVLPNYARAGQPQTVHKQQLKGLRLNRPSPKLRRQKPSPGRKSPFVTMLKPQALCKKAREHWAFLERVFERRIFGAWWTGAAIATGIQPSLVGRSRIGSAGILMTQRKLPGCWPSPPSRRSNLAASFLGRLPFEQSATRSSLAASLRRRRDG